MSTACWSGWSLVGVVLAVGCGSRADDPSSQVDEVSTRVDDASSRIGELESAIDGLEGADATQAAENEARDARDAEQDAVDEALATAVAELKAAVSELEAELESLLLRLASVEAAMSEVATASSVTDLSDALTERTEDLDARIGEIEARTLVPVGTVIDWYRPDAATPVPTGWQIMDGSAVTLPASPLYGVTLPDMTGKFTRGVVEQADVAVEGGADVHDHVAGFSHEHHERTDPDGSHLHTWAYWESGTLSWSSGDDEEIINWTNGIGGDGMGIYPLAVYDQENDAFHTGYSGDHVHLFSTDPETLEATSDTASNVPAFVGFMKLIRIF